MLLESSGDNLEFTNRDEMKGVSRVQGEEIIEERGDEPRREGGGTRGGSQCPQG